MPNNPLTPVESAALHWVILQYDQSFSDWDDFIAWLEISPDHNDAFQRMSLIDADLNALRLIDDAANIDQTNAIQPARPTRLGSERTDLAGAPLISATDIARSAPPKHAPKAANDDLGDEYFALNAKKSAKHAVRRRWFIGGLAAALVAAISLPSLAPMLSGQNDLRRIETAAGEQQVITLDDGTRIDVNGDTILELIPSEPRFARLSQGEAMFTVVHDDRRPFIVETGGAKIVDLGTAFNVIRTKDHTQISVSEGRVIYNPESDNVPMRAGQALDAPDARDGAQRLRAKAVDIASVGGWRGGVLVYQEAPLAQVVEDLRRTSGVELSVSVDAADIIFRGALTIGDDGQKTIEDLAALSGTRILPQGRGWMLSR